MHPRVQSPTESRAAQPRRPANARPIEDNTDRRALLHLQRTAGNAAVSGVLHRNPVEAAVPQQPAGLPLQRASFYEAGSAGKRPGITDGDYGPAVIELQWMLGANRTGIFDSATRAAVNTFQAQHDRWKESGWPPSGVGRETWTALDDHEGVPGRRTDLAKGSRGPAVRLLQRMLIEVLDPSQRPGVMETATFDSATRKAVDVFQTLHCPPPSDVGPLTWKALDATAGTGVPPVWADGPPRDPPGTVGGHDARPYVVYENEVHLASKGAGDSTFMNNNPGNITVSEFANTHGAFKDVKGHFPTHSHFAVFPSYPVGRAAINALLKTSTFWNLSVDRAVSRWTARGPDEFSNPEVMRSLAIVLPKIPLTRAEAAKTKVSDLDDNQLEKMVIGICQKEGTQLGVIVTCDTQEPNLQWARAKLGCPPPTPPGTPAPLGTSDAGAP